MGTADLQERFYLQTKNLSIFNLQGREWYGPLDVCLCWLLIQKLFWQIGLKASFKMPEIFLKKNENSVTRFFLLGALSLKSK